MAKAPLYIAILAGILICFSPGRLYAQKDTVKVGVFINSLHDFNFYDKSYKIDFWLWLLYSNAELSFDEAIEIRPSKEFDLSNTILDSTAGLQWLSMKVRAEIVYHWQLDHYPFDNQMLNVVIESADADTSSMVFIPDFENSKIDPNFKLDEWDIDTVIVNNAISTYETTYGDHDLTGQSSYPAINIAVYLNRKNSWLSLFKLITGVVVAFFISCLVFLIKPTNVDPRFGLCVGGLFAAVGNKYIIEGTVPSTNTITMLDNIHNLTYVLILLIILVSIFSLKLFEKGTEKSIRQSQRVDRISLFVIIGIYLLAMAYLIVVR